MGNTCGCVDPAEKDAEVKVENKTQNNQHRQASINNYRDSTVSKNYVGNTHNVNQAGQIPQLFETED